MFEYIKREIKAEKTIIPEDYTKVQVSYNNWGHLCLRAFNPENPDKDILIVLNKQLTDTVRRFLQNVRSDYY